MPLTCLEAFKVQVKLQSSGLFPQFPIMLGGCSPRSTYYFYKLQKQHVCFIIYIAQRDHHWLAPMTAQPDIHHNTIYNSDRPSPGSSGRTCHLQLQREYYAAITKARLSGTLNEGKCYQQAKCVCGEQITKKE